MTTIELYKISDIEIKLKIERKTTRSSFTGKLKTSPKRKFSGYNIRSIFLKISTCKIPAPIKCLHPTKMEVAPSLHTVKGWFPQAIFVFITSQQPVVLAKTVL